MSLQTWSCFWILHWVCVMWFDQKLLQSNRDLHRTPSNAGWTKLNKQQMHTNMSQQGPTTIALVHYFKYIEYVWVFENGTWVKTFANVWHGSHQFDVKKSAITLSAITSWASTDSKFLVFTSELWSMHVHGSSANRSFTSILWLPKTKTSHFCQHISRVFVCNIFSYMYGGFIVDRIQDLWG